MTVFDAIVVGAGPAGMAAALALSRAGVQPAIIDSQQEPGGQVYRGIISNSGKPLGTLLGKDYLEGADLARELLAGPIERYFGYRVWNANDKAVDLAGPSGVRALSYKKLIICTGAYERSFPVPGWNLLGAATAGSVQSMLKMSGKVPSGDVWFVGSGPLVLLVATQLLSAGVRIAGIVEPEGALDRTAMVRNFGDVIGSLDAVSEGLSWQRRLRRHGVTFHRKATSIRLNGSERVESISFVCGGKAHCYPAGTVLLHGGIQSEQRIARLLNLQLDWNEKTCSWTVQRDRWGATAHGSIYVAGDGAEIEGRNCAAARGALAGIAVAASLGAISRHDAEKRSAPLWFRLSRARRLAKLLDGLFPPLETYLELQSDATVCRCEGVSVDRVRSAIGGSARSIAAVKYLTRCGMGECQGRLCESSLGKMLRERIPDLSNEERLLSVRAPLFPVRAGLLSTGTGFAAEPRGSGDDAA